MLYVFGACEFDTDRRVLHRAGTPVRLEPKVFDLLAYLIQHHDHFIAREELYEQLWPRQYVSESALTYCIAAARRAVGDTGRAQRIIKTVHGRGYCFIAPVGQRAAASTTADTTAGADLPSEAAALVPHQPASAAPARPVQSPAPIPQQPPAPTERTWSTPGPVEPERRQLTVLWCRGVAAGANDLALDPEELHAVLQEVQRVCDQVVQRFEGWMAQHFGDGFVVYFGYPRAHEDDAQRAVYAGLDMVRGIARLSPALQQQSGVVFTAQIGIHTGMVVISAIGGSDGRTPLALGHTPQAAAQLASVAAPNTVVVSPVTLKLVEGYFIAEASGSYILDDPTEPLVVYQVLRESTAQSRLDVALATRLTPYVGREHEVGWLCERWEQSADGQGQVVVLQGEAGIGKSRLIREFHLRMPAEHSSRVELRCSPYHQQSPLYPLVEQMPRWLQWHQDDTPAVKLQKLEESVASWHGAMEEAVPLLAALLSLPLEGRYTSLDLTPPDQKQRTLATLLAWVLSLAEPQPLCLVIEDLHWADSSTLEFLTLFVDQVPMARLLVILTCRPDCTLPWSGHSYITHIVLNRLTPTQTVRLIERITAGETLPTRLQQQLVAQTNGVPLFVEEMTKMVLELGLDKEPAEAYAVPGACPTLAIPSTLYDSLMARLDRQGIGKRVAQLGATLGREFSYGVLRAISPLDETLLHQGLAQLVQAEILYQRGLPPQSQYIFKHALLQDAAYQSLLRQTRRQYHRQIAQVLEEHFPATCAAQPELLAHHYTQAGLNAPAVLYWQRAGQRAMERSAYVEALAHLRQGLALTDTLPATPERLQHELSLSMGLGAALMATQGFAAPEVEHAYIRARECSRQVGDPLQSFTALRGLGLVYLMRGEVQMAYEQGTHLLQLAQRQRQPMLLIEAHRAVGVSLCFLGALTDALAHLHQGLALYEEAEHYALIVRYVQDPGMVCLAYAAWALWWCGYPDQALRHINTALDLAQQCRHPFCQALALTFAVILHQCRREVQAVLTHVEASLALAQQYGFPLFIAMGGVLRHWALAAHRPSDDSVAQIAAGVAAYRATGAELYRPYFLGLLAEAYGSRGRVDVGLQTLHEALALVETTGERLYEAELHRLRGQLLLARSVVHAAEAEACYQAALAIARRQQARLLELRATVSLSRLWQQQGRRAEARHLLGEAYGWFTEGFDTADLQEARRLLDSLQ